MQLYIVFAYNIHILKNMFNLTKYQHIFKSSITKILAKQMYRIKYSIRYGFISKLNKYHIYIDIN